MLVLALVFIPLSAGLDAAALAAVDAALNRGDGCIELTNTRGIVCAAGLHVRSMSGYTLPGRWFVFSEGLAPESDPACFGNDELTHIAEPFDELGEPTLLFSSSEQPCEQRRSQESFNLLRRVPGMLCCAVLCCAVLCRAVPACVR